MNYNKNLFTEYLTLQDKRAFFRLLDNNIPWCIDSEGEFDRLYDFLIDLSNRDKTNLFKNGKQSLYFRGVNEARYCLLTSAQVYAQTNNTPWNSIDQYRNYCNELLLILGQNKHLIDYYKSLKVEPNDMLSLAFLQHYGAKTPMLDFTHNVDIALYFATKDNNIPQNMTDSKDIDDYSSLYIIDREDYLNDIKPVNITKLLPHNYSGIKFFDSIKIGILDFDKHNNSEDSAPLLWSNLRIVAQQGAQLFYNECELPLEVYFKKNSMQLIKCVNLNKKLTSHIKSKIKLDDSDVFPKEEEIAKDAMGRALNHVKLNNNSLEPHK